MGMLASPSCTTFSYIYIYIYIYKREKKRKEREREEEREKVKAVCGSCSTAALWHIVLLAERVPAHTKQRERPLLAKEGTVPGI
jgi:hypothetical protein